MRETVQAFRARHPDRRLWALFEAESNTSRRRVFQDRYPTAFEGADEVVFVRPLVKDDDLSEAEQLDPVLLIEDLRRRGARARYIPDPEEILNLLVRESEPGDVVLFMSGRDFHGLAPALLSALEGSPV